MFDIETEYYNKHNSFNAADKKIVITSAECFNKIVEGFFIPMHILR